MLQMFASGYTYDYYTKLVTDGVEKCKNVDATSIKERKLNVEDVSGAFLILAIGVVISTISFISEKFLC